MITLIVEIKTYNKERNTCEAQLLNGEVINLDPFVSCAIKQTDDDYKNNKGAELIGNTYLLTAYTVYKDSVVPHEDGMILL